MAADGGLGGLEDVAEVGDAELVAFEDAEEAQPHRVGEAIHPGEEGVGLGGDLDHPLIRIYC